MVAKGNIRSIVEMGAEDHVIVYASQVAEYNYLTWPVGEAKPSP